ncbi:heme oxygenase 1, chloroplastic-like [Curcuma longa]|uniref:heme oxygenase 1, chloroplastic-like n=1 Tax=Curcuma longa TaxID=136217 RepID=UPI003D9F7276
MSQRKHAPQGLSFVDEMRVASMKLHPRNLAKEGEKEPEGPPVSQWEPSIEGLLQFLVDSKLVYDTFEAIIHQADYYAELRNTGLERSEKLAKDLEWFEYQKRAIPQPSARGHSHARYLEQVSDKDPQAFICHFYNVYFAHSAGGPIIGRMVSAKILNNKELEFYKWDGVLSQLSQNVRDKLNKVTSDWSRDEKDRCLEETEISFKYSKEILGLLIQS